VPIPFTVFGGAAAARLILVDIVRREDLIGILNPNDVILKIEDVTGANSGIFGQKYLLNL
ncbi:hypothetical protein ANCDUO_22122, partial [Ancylostoma duodenale]